MIITVWGNSSGCSENPLNCTLRSVYRNLSVILPSGLDMLALSCCMLVLIVTKICCQPVQDRLNNTYMLHDLLCTSFVGRLAKLANCTSIVMTKASFLLGRLWPQEGDVSSLSANYLQAVSPAPGSI